MTAKDFEEELFNCIRAAKLHAESCQQRLVSSLEVTVRIPARATYARQYATREYRVGLFVTALRREVRRFQKHCNSLKDVDSFIQSLLQARYWEDCAVLKPYYLNNWNRCMVVNYTSGEIWEMTSSKLQAMCNGAFASKAEDIMDENLTAQIEIETDILDLKQTSNTILDLIKKMDSSTNRLAGIANEADQQMETLYK